MDAETSLRELYIRLHEQLTYRDSKIATLASQCGRTYDRLSEISRHIELLASELREALICCHNKLQALGYQPGELPMPGAPDIELRVEQKSVRIVIDGMLPFPIKGGVHFLHEKLDAALTGYSRDNALPRPLFDERCAVVFIHHYAATGKAIRNMRDYDNVERRCITNVIARHFLRDDSPACYISIDILAVGQSNHTEVRIMAIPEFRAFVMSREIEYFPQGIASKNALQTYQKIHSEN